MTEIIGGSYKEVKASHPKGKHDYHAHHVIAHKSYEGVLGITKDEGPAIRMTSTDHRKTASNDNGADGEAWRDKQKELLKQGKIDQAWNNEVADIRKHCGTKYDQHIKQAEKQMLKLDKEGKIKLDDKFKEKLEQGHEKRPKSSKKEPTQVEKKEVFSRNSSSFEQKENTGKNR